MMQHARAETSVHSRTQPSVTAPPRGGPAKHVWRHLNLSKCCLLRVVFYNFRTQPARLFTIINLRIVDCWTMACGCQSCQHILCPCTSVGF